MKTIDEIKPYTANAKLHPAWHIEKIANSIKAFGCKQPIVIDKDGIIVAGHGRFEAMTKLLGYTLLEEKGATKKGEAVIPYILADDLTEIEIKAYRLADNQLNAMTGIDMSLVLPELESMSLEFQALTYIELPDFSPGGKDEQGDVTSVAGGIVEQKLLSAVSSFMKHNDATMEDAFDYVRTNFKN